MRKAVFAALVMATLVGGIATSAAAAVTPELRPFVGAFIPTGTQRDILKDAVFVGGQGGVEVAQSLHVIGTLAYAPSKSKSSGVCVYQYDTGIETFRPYQMTERWQMRPFLGAGLGGRTYVDHNNGDHSETIFAAYGSLGTEFQLDHLAFRLEGRDYMTRFKGLQGNQGAESRNDVSVVSALAIHW